MNERFPWVRTHFTLLESSIVEDWRKHFTDEQITAFRARSAERGAFKHPTRSHSEVIAYLKRNPRKPKDAA